MSRGEPLVGWKTLAKDKFKLGDRVKPSRYGLRRNLWQKWRTPTSGVVVALPEAAFLVAVMWNNRKTPQRLHCDFVSKIRPARPPRP